MYVFPHLFPLPLPPQNRGLLNRPSTHCPLPQQRPCRRDYLFCQCQILFPPLPPRLVADVVVAVVAVVVVVVVVVVVAVAAVAVVVVVVAAVAVVVVVAAAVVVVGVLG